MPMELASLDPNSDDIAMLGKDVITDIRDEVLPNAYGLAILRQRCT